MGTFTLRNVSFTYPGQTQKALDDLSLTVEQGEFLVVCGPSGCGKSTLLRQLKPVLTPHGERAGEVLFDGVPLDTLDQRTQSQMIGFVSQFPEGQLVTDKVWHELAFGLESLGWDTPSIRRRVAEMASFFGMESWFYQSVTHLSGGQKQLLNLASVMVLRPDILILDEPTGQLDPIAATDFLNTLAKLNRELGTTILLTEHRLEDALPLASRVAVMDAGKLLWSGVPAQVGAALKHANHAMFRSMPTAIRVWAAVENGETPAPCPVTVGEGRSWLSRRAAVHPLQALPPEPEHRYPEEPSIEVKGLWFKYDKNGPDVLKDLTLSVKRGEFLALLGGNGAGKSTLLRLLAGLEKPYRGTLDIHGTVGVLPQNPQTLFVKKTVREDLCEVLTDIPEEKLARVAALCRLNGCLERHPYDLSGGEQQRAALAKVLLLEPEILLLDEPTKGMDGEFKEIFSGILNSLLETGVTVLMVSHDVEFCAAHAHRCALLFDGDLVADGSPRAFFSGNHFYTTSANRIAGDFLPQAVTTADLIFALGGVLPQAPTQLPAAPSQATIQTGPDLPQESPQPSSAPPHPFPKPSPKLPLWRKVTATLFGGLAVAIFLHFIGIYNILPIFSLLNLTNRAYQQFYLYAFFSVSLLLFAFSVTQKHVSAKNVPTPPRQKAKLSRRTILATVFILLLIPLTLFFGVYILEDKKYYFISLLVVLEAISPFFLVFEGRKPQARELVLIAVLCALGVASRAALFMLPQFKPILALTILSGVVFGGETGFLVGSMTMLVSNVIFSQGPWTPWQMFAMGIIGFLAGVLFREGRLPRSRCALCVFGALSAVLLYGGIMNFQSALQASPGVLNGGVILTYCLTGLPMDLIHAAATWFFLWVAAEPMLEKLDRIRVKYGLTK